ncbi:MAG: hypothetical protein ACD_79C00896G0003 [uncultured bacterium]|nr:MAG: hypothetical protein ACD_79C00896G0003 [uncultured bacterium]
MIKDKRHNKRRHLIEYFDVVNVKNNQVIGHLVDITAEGMMIISKDLIPENTTSFLEIKLPKELKRDHADYIDFEAKVLWTRKNINPGYYSIGFQIISITEENLKIIKETIL